MNKETNQEKYIKKTIVKITTGYVLNEKEFINFEGKFAFGNSSELSVIIAKIISTLTIQEFRKEHYCYLECNDPTLYCSLKDEIKNNNDKIIHDRVKISKKNMLYTFNQGLNVYITNVTL